MREHMAAFKRAGRNTVYLACFNHGRSHWPSRVMHEVLDDGDNGLIAPEFKGRDPLAEAIEAGAAHGIRVFAWLEFGFASHHRYSPYQRTLLKVNPHWAALNREGKPVVKNDFHWMNAFDPSVQELLLRLCVELAQRYPKLAGVQGDDRLPAQPAEGGYHEAVLAAFGKAQPNSPALPADKDPAWVRFRAGLLTEWLAKLHTAVKAARPECEISLAPSAYPFALVEYLQDWPNWLKLGLCDELIPQLYRRDEMSFARLAVATGKTMAEHASAASAHTKLGAGMLWSLGPKTVATPELLTQWARASRAAGIPGDVLFHSMGVVEQADEVAKALAR
jgi:uncharacterized lipoprotein YddW (UPF0748 family)